jgi:hypothetical protein
MPLKLLEKKGRNEQFGVDFLTARGTRCKGWWWWRADRKKVLHRKQNAVLDHSRGGASIYPGGRCLFFGDYAM